MQIVLLGTGFPFPTPDRAGPATLVRAGELDLLFDTGRGVLMRLAGTDSTAGKVHTTFLTHLHSDHTTDFNDLFTTHWISLREYSPLNVIGPPGTERFCDLTRQSLEPDIRWRIEHTPDLVDHDPGFALTEVTEGVVFDEGGVRVIAALTHHPPVSPTIGFRVEHAGKSVVIGGDSLPCEGLDTLCAGADAYVQTVFRPGSIGPLSVAMSYHSSTFDAAETAKRGGVRRLVYTHMMPAPRPGEEDDWIGDAKEHFDGEVYLTNDLDVIEV